MRDDLWAVLSGAPLEVPDLILALKEGKVNGSTYNGECSCLVGTLEKAKEKNKNTVGLIKRDADRPIEKFFLGISKGDTPDTNQFSAFALQWAEEWFENMQKAFSPALQKKASHAND